MSIESTTRLSIGSLLGTRGDSPRGDRPEVPSIVFGTLRAATGKRETTPQTPDRSSAPKAVNNSFGPDQTRPEGDYRNAQQIIKDSDLLKNLGDQHGSDGGPNLKDALKKQVGDFETDADAAYRAVQVLEHVEKYDEAGGEIAARPGWNRAPGRGLEGNGVIDGFTKSGDAKHGTEAGRLQDFGKLGYDSLKGGEPKTSSPESTPTPTPTTPPTAPPPPPPAPLLPLANELRPAGDTRSAAEIVNANPTLKNLGNQEGVKDNLKKQVGDFEHDADAAYRASQVIDYIKNVDGKGQAITKKTDGNDPGNARIDGFSFSKSDGRVIANPDTEAGRLQDFGKSGYESLKGIDGKGADGLIVDLNSKALVDAVKGAGGNPDRLGADYFATGKTDASAADKTAALIKLNQTLATYTAGQTAYQDTGPSGQGPFQGDGLSPGQKRDAFVNDVRAKIDQLGSDPEVQKFQSEKVPDALHARVDADPRLQTELQRRLDAASTTSALESAFAAKDRDGKPVSTTEALSKFISQPNFYGQALGAAPKLQDALKNAPKEIQDKVRAGYDEITSGDKLQQSIDSGKPADKAVIDLAVDKATYDAVLDQKTVDEGSARYDDVIAKTGRADVLNGLTPEDLFKGLGVSGVDDPKLEPLIEKNLDSLFPSAKERPSAAVVVAAVRSIVDSIRHGASFDVSIADVSADLGNKLPQGVTDTFKAGVLHAASGLLLAGALATRSATGSLGTKPETATQSFQAAALLVQGGSKFVRDQLNRANAASDPAGDNAVTRFNQGAIAAVKDIENVGKGVSAVGSVLGLITGSIAAHQSAANGDKVAAGFQGTFAALNGLGATASAGEITAYVVGRVAGAAGQAGVQAAAAVLEGVAGTVGAVIGGVAAVGGLIYSIISSVKADQQRDHAIGEWFDGLSKDFASFGITPPELGTTLAKPNASDDLTGNLNPVAT